MAKSKEETSLHRGQIGYFAIAAAMAAKTISICSGFLWRNPWPIVFLEWTSWPYSYPPKNNEINKGRKQKKLKEK